MRQIEKILKKDQRMQLKFFSIPIFASGEEEELNKFLRSVKVIDVRRELVMASETACWAICVLFMPHAGDSFGSTAQSTAPRTYGGRGRIDYREVLSTDEFVIFTELRTIRKQLSENDGVPPYVVFTDAELAEIVKMGECTLESLKKIKGVGVGKIEKYGIRFSEEASKVFAKARESAKKDEKNDMPF